MVDVRRAGLGEDELRDSQGYGCWEPETEASSEDRAGDVCLGRIVEERKTYCSRGYQDEE